MDKYYRTIRTLAPVVLVLLVSMLLIWHRLCVPWLVAETQPAPRPHPVLRLSLPGIDLGADAWPTQPGSDGHVLVWCYPHHAEDITTLLILPGAPALPLPGEMVQRATRPGRSSF